MINLLKKAIAKVPALDSFCCQLIHYRKRGRPMGIREWRGFLKEWRYSRAHRRAGQEFEAVYAEAISLLPSGIISYALDSLGNFWGWNPGIGEIQDATEDLRMAISEAVAEGDCNAARSNTWDPSRAHA